jgi:hypothetical protein
MMPSGLAAATPRNRDPEPPEQDVPCVRLKSNQPSFHATQLGSLADYAERSASPLMPGFKLQRIRCPPRRVGECDRDTLAERVVVGALERRQDGVQDADCGHRWTVVRPPRPLAWRADTTWSSCEIVRLLVPVAQWTSHSRGQPCCFAVDGEHVDAEARCMDADDPVPEAILERLVTDVRAVLGADLVGIYLYGSYVSGGFDPRVSDLDLVVVTAPPVEAIDLDGVGRMHGEFMSR